MSINRDFTYCIGKKSKKCDSCKRKMTKKELEESVGMGLWYVAPPDNNRCHMYIEKKINLK
jgi:hypothetical protein